MTSSSKKRITTLSKRKTMTLSKEKSMTFQTALFGPVDADEASAICFPAGLPGFETCRRFTILPHPKQPALIFLQSLDRPELCFLTVPAIWLRSDYQPAIADEDRELLGFPANHQPTSLEVMALAILSLGEDSPPTANLLA